VAGCEDVAAFARVDEDFREVILGDNLHLPSTPKGGSPSAPLAYGSSLWGSWLYATGDCPLRSVTWQSRRHCRIG